MIRVVKLLCAASLLVVLLAGCGGSKRAASTPEASAPKTALSESEGQNPAVSQTDVADANGSTPGQASTDAGDETVSVSDREAGLDKLSSYRATWQVQWQSSDSSEPEQIAWEWFQDFTAEPKALHMGWKSIEGSSGSQPGAMEMWQFADTSYMVTGGADASQCMQVSSEEGNTFDSSFMNPSSLGSVSNARYVGTDTVNGIKAKHYQYDDKGLALLGSSRLAGDLWIADDGGYVVKDTAAWDGRAFGLGAADQAAGSGSWKWELTDVNEAISIKPPENCESAAASLPVLADATERTTIGDTLTYKTGVKLKVVLQFYKDEMPKTGWTLQGDPTVGDEFAQATFVREEQTAQVVFTPDGKKTTVMISVQ